MAALTGLAYTLTPQLDAIAYKDHFHVADVGDKTLPLTRQVAAALEAMPVGTLSSVVPPDASDATTKVIFDVEGMGENQRTVYVDPYSGEVRGVLTTWFDATPLNTWLDDMHRNLHLGEVGRLYSELAASWLWVIVLGGLVLWLHHLRGRRRRLRAAMVPDRSAGKGVRRTRTWHASIGVWIGIVLLGLSATGLTWSAHAGARFDIVQSRLNSGEIALDTSIRGGPSQRGHDHHDDSGGEPSNDARQLGALPRVLDAARSAGLDGPVKVTPPADASTAWTVAQIDDRWPVRRDQVAVHPATAQITDQIAWSDQPALAKLSSLGVLAHMAILFGPINQIVLAGAAIGLLCMIFFGYRMWWQRRPTRADRRRAYGTPPPRGGWRHLNTGLLVAVLIATIAVGWAVPLLGLSLIGFLALDGAIWLARKRPWHRKSAESTLA